MHKPEPSCDCEMSKLTQYSGKKCNCNKTPKVNLKSRPAPVFFGNKNGQSAKKMKLSDNTNTTNTVNKNKPSIQEQKRTLPIFDKRNKLLDKIKRHSTLIVIAETGCGKTTQIPQYIYSARLHEAGRIAVTQPRRVAAISVAMRVAQEVGSGLSIGETVGYSVRFEDVTSNKTKIKYVTDGILLREAMADSLLMEYTVILLDEAHERTVHTDVLFGIVKNAQKERQERNLTPLKILIMSATMDVDHFSSYFNDCLVVYIEGRTYPVSLYYTSKPQEDYQTACVSTFFKIHREAPASHDVIIFLTGQEEIETVAHQIRVLSKDPEVDGPPVKVLTLYAAQSGTQQMQVFQSTPSNTRKVIVSTNIAETSITIPGIRYVIDSGMVKVRTFHPATGLDLLKVQRVSQEQAGQRAGRAGRDSEGKCYRLYTRVQFELMQKSTVPEIQRANLNSVVLQLLALGIDALTFDFMDKPPRDSVMVAYERLKLLEAIDGLEEKNLTEIGRKMARFPLDPHFSKVLLAAEGFGCMEEALSVVALLSSESVLLNPPSKREEAKAARERFRSPYGDHITLLNIFSEFNKLALINRRQWCHEHYINLRNIVYAREIKGQLKEICERIGLSMSSCGSEMDKVRWCLLSGLFTNVAELQRDKKYLTLEKKQVVTIHPSSVLHGQYEDYVIYTEVIQTNKCYIRGVTYINSEWLTELVPEYVRSRNIRLRTV